MNDLSDIVDLVTSIPAPKHHTEVRELIIKRELSAVPYPCDEPGPVLDTIIIRAEVVDQKLEWIIDIDRC
jgi:hypothetical protein